MKQALDSRHSCRLLQLDGPPQALAFSNNAGDLVFALGSRLCLVSHKLYLPTSYLVEVYSQEWSRWDWLLYTHGAGEQSPSCFFRNCVRSPLMW